ELGKGREVFRHRVEIAQVEELAVERRERRVRSGIRDERPRRLAHAVRCIERARLGRVEERRARRRVDEEERETRGHLVAREGSYPILAGLTYLDLIKEVRRL